MGQKITTADAFTDRPFAGNPAAVCVLASARSDAWMQDVAREMNLSETAFLLRSDADDAWSLRWFTPAVEVDLCGHATLASAHVLWEEGHLDPERPAPFETRSGRLVARRTGEWIEMDFPATPPRASAEEPSGLLEALGINPRWVGQTRFDYLVEVDSEATVRRLAPDFHRLRALAVRGVIVTAPAAAGRDHDFVSRFFAPGAGVDEDPVTGSAHCALAPYWAERLGRRELVGRQVSSRGGTVGVRVEGERVILCGRAITVLRGELCVD